MFLCPKEKLYGGCIRGVSSAPPDIDRVAGYVTFTGEFDSEKGLTFLGSRDVHVFYAFQLLPWDSVPMPIDDQNVHFSVTELGEA